MIESLIRLESLVEKLIHHVMMDGKSMLHHHQHDGRESEAFEAPPDGHRGRRPSAPIESLHEAVFRQRYDEAPHPGHVHWPREPVETSLEKMEDRVESLMKEVQEMMVKKSENPIVRCGESIGRPSREDRDWSTML